MFDSKYFEDHEQLSFFYDKVTGLKAVIALHNTENGPAIGGCRMWPHVSMENAIDDAMRLSRGMTYKAAISGLPLGGAKAVIIGDAQCDKSPQLLQAMGRAVDTLNGRYIIAEDVGTTVADMAEIRKTTRHVVGLPVSLGGSGDPSSGLR